MVNDLLQWAALSGLGGYLGWQRWQAGQVARALEAARQAAATERRAVIAARVAEMRASGMTGRELIRRRLKMEAP